MCITRGVYTSSSVCLGIFGSTEVLRFTAFLSLLCTLFYIMVIYLILNFFSGIAAARLISLSTLLNWVIRFFVYNHYSIKSIKEHTLVKAKIKEFNA
jgi:hypothetical protein